MEFEELRDRLENLSERLAWDILQEELAGRDDICKCDDCITDMMAYTLSRSRPYYSTSLYFIKRITTDENVKFEIRQVVKEAIDIVSKNAHK